MPLWHCQYSKVCAECCAAKIVVLVIEWLGFSEREQLICVTRVLLSHAVVTQTLFVLDMFTPCVVCLAL